ncbi:MAG: M48 family metalloprotease [Pseudomonadota bacterium]
MQRLFIRLSALLGLAALAACDAPQPIVSAPPPAQVAAASTGSLPEIRQGPVQPQNVASFRQIVRQMEPVLERECRTRAPRLNCDFAIQLYGDPRLPPNAFQTLDDNGRPVLGFTETLVRDVRNADELAFVLGHEAAHHIAGHIERTQANATLGAASFGVLAAALGRDAGSVRQAQQLGAAVAARSYSKSFELEADRLGTILTARAGYDPLVGAAYFTRIPDPGNRFLGTHPPNAERIQAVRRAAAGL